MAIIVMIASLATFQDYFNSMLVHGMNDEYATEKLNAYTNKGGRNFFGDSIGEVLQNVTSKVPTYIFFLFLFKKAIFDKSFRINMNKPLNAFVNVSFCLFFASLGCNLIDMNSGTFATRLFSMLVLPAILISSIVLIDEKAKFYTMFMKWKWISIEFTYFFAFFYTMVHHS